jgi:drug/metabolite transporter (DMT)-like permease
VSFERLSKWDALAWVAGLGVLFVTAIDWYSTRLGDAARQIQHDVQVPNGPLGSDIPNTIQQQARLVAQAQEKNLWQVHGAIDRVILIVLLAAALCAALAAVMRVAAHRYRGSFTPSAAAAWLAGFGALLVLYRIVQKPGDDQVTTLKSGPWLAFVALGLLCLGASLAWRGEREAAGSDERPGPAAAEPERAPRPGAT